MKKDKTSPNMTRSIKTRGVPSGQKIVDNTSNKSLDSKSLEALKLKQMRELQELQLQHLRQIHEQQLKLAMAQGEILMKDLAEAKEKVCSDLECTHEETLEEICE